jgi:sporulation protein YlmC with PRC-barrel domain
MHVLRELEEFSNSPVKVSRMIGMPVVNREGYLGTLKEVVIDPQTGKVRHALVSIGGFLGFGGKLFAVPFHSLNYDCVHNAYELDIPKAQLRASVGIDAENWPSISEEKLDRDVYQYFGRAPFWD